MSFDDAIRAHVAALDARAVFPLEASKLVQVAPRAELLAWLDENAARRRLRRALHERPPPLPARNRTTATPCARLRRLGRTDRGRRGRRLRGAAEQGVRQ